MKVGLGYDIHKLVEGRKLILGGVDVPYEKGLEGHSDADVLTHAVCDALLGALGKGDIGRHFPDTDEKYRGVFSLKLLEQVGDFVHQDGYAVGNVDAVIIAERPRLKDFVGDMQTNIAAALDIPPGAVNVKATTNEGLGAVGRQEGIAAQAVVLITKRNTP